MVKFILALPDEVVTAMEQFRASCEVPSLEELIISPFRIFVPKGKSTEPICCTRLETSS